MIPHNEKNCSRIIKPLILILAIVVISGYSIWRVKDIVRGPQIVLYSPIDGANSKNDLIKITGKAERINQLFINGQKVFTDEDGNFSENYLLANGYNALEITATDSMGRQAVKKLQLFLSPKS